VWAPASSRPRGFNDLFAHVASRCERRPSQEPSGRRADTARPHGGWSLRSHASSPTNPAGRSAAVSCRPRRPDGGSDRHRSGAGLSPVRWRCHRFAAALLPLLQTPASSRSVQRGSKVLSFLLTRVAVLVLRTVFGLRADAGCSMRVVVVFRRNAGSR
jgi:hypothetical protein